MAAIDENEIQEVADAPELLSCATAPELVQCVAAPRINKCISAPSFVQCVDAPALYGRYKEDDRLILVPEMITHYMVGIFEGY